MPRKRFIPVTQIPYHISNRCNNKEWFQIPLPIVWAIFCNQLSDSSNRFSVLVHSLVVMSNHFHMMVTTPLGNLDKFLRHFLTETARALQKASGRINHIFGGRSNQSILGSAYSVAYVYKYIYRNPIRAGLCNRAEQYPFSSLSALLKRDCAIPIVEGTDGFWNLLPREISERLDWLNRPTPKEQETLIANGLRRSHFQFTKSNSQRNELSLLARSYGIHDPYDPYLLGPKGE